MRFFTIILTLSLILWFSSCSSENCTDKLIANHPQVIKYIQELELAEFHEITCSTETVDKHTFKGYQEPGGKCSHFEVKLDVGKITITTYTFKNEEDKRLYDFIVYSFESEEDLKKMKNFVPDASLYLEKNKDIHEFFIEEDQVVLYYFGFP